MKKNKEYLTTGEFAELFGVKKQTMFHYDQTGIFCPEITGENGYRYYSHNQLEEFSIILMLREMGLSVAEIKEQIDSHSPERLIKLLEAKSREIDERIEHLKWSKEYMERKIGTTMEGIRLRKPEGGLRTGEIFMTEFPDEAMVMTDYLGPGDPRSVNEAIGDHYRYLRSLGMKSCYPDGAAIARDSVRKSGDAVEYRYDKYYTVLTRSETAELLRDKDRFSDVVVDKGGTFLVIYDNRGYSKVGECLVKLLEYAEENGLKLGDRFYEDVIWDDLSSEDYTGYLIQLSIRVL